MDYHLFFPRPVCVLAVLFLLLFLLFAPRGRGIGARMLKVGLAKETHGKLQQGMFAVVRHLYNDTLVL